jgi:hypothetical protein
MFSTLSLAHSLNAEPNQASRAGSPQAAEPGAKSRGVMTQAQTTELLDWVSACQSAYSLQSRTKGPFFALPGQLEENRQSLVNYVNAVIEQHLREFDQEGVELRAQKALFDAKFEALNAAALVALSALSVASTPIRKDRQEVLAAMQALEKAGVSKEPKDVKDPKQ